MRPQQVKHPHQRFEEIHNQIRLGSVERVRDGAEAFAISAEPGGSPAQGCQRRHALTSLKREAGTGDGRQPLPECVPEEVRDGSTRIGTDRYGNDFMTVSLERLGARNGLGHVTPTIPLHCEHDPHTGNRFAYLCGETVKNMLITCE